MKAQPVRGGMSEGESTVFTNRDPSLTRRRRTSMSALTGLPARKDRDELRSEVSVATLSIAAIYDA